MAEAYKLQIGQNIARRRKELGLTQKDLADATHYKEAQTVSRWERGQNLPSDLDPIAKALKWTLAEMAAGVEPPNLRVARQLGIATAPLETPEPFAKTDTQAERLEAIEDRLGRIERQLAIITGVSMEAVGADVPPGPDIVIAAPGSGKTATASLIQVVKAVQRDVDELLSHRREAEEQLRGFDVESARDLLNLVQEVQARQGREVGKRELQSRAATGR